MAKYNDSKRSATHSKGRNATLERKAQRYAKGLVLRQGDADFDSVMSNDSQHAEHSTQHSVYDWGKHGA